MILILFALIIYIFLLVGALVFVCCVAVPHSREHALSAALWCAVWGPCIVALVILAGFGLIISSLAKDHSHFGQLVQLLLAIGPAYAIVGLLGTIVVASVIAWFHQLLVDRMTFFLFRIYACVVSTGIGSIWGLAFIFWLGGRGLLPLGVAVMLLLCAGFGYCGFRWAHLLRGGPPQGFTWITPEEFAGTQKPSTIQ
jgi:hypothetical protein